MKKVISKLERRKLRMLKKIILKANIVHFSDSGQTKAYVYWGDGSSTEGDPNGVHMQALLQRATREGLAVQRETW